MTPSMTPDLFRQTAECPQDSPALDQTLFDVPPGYPLPGPHRLSGEPDLGTEGNYQTDRGIDEEKQVDGGR